MATKILLLNSDSPFNRGDRAILAGNITLLKHQFGDDCQITALSNFPERDQRWFGIKFLNMGVQSLSPIDLLILLRKAAVVDYVFWGGGEFLKDYTNKLGLLYWWLKIRLLSWVNPKLYGLFQGIGPTHSQFGRGLIRRTVDCCSLFFTRDQESADKLTQWGCRTPILAGFDPAIVCQPTPTDTESMLIKLQSSGISRSDLDNSIGIGPRHWFHYQNSGWLPHKYRHKLPWSRKIAPKAASQLIEAFAHYLDQLVDQQQQNLILLPMHMASSENDQGLCHQLREAMEHKHRVHVIEGDELSPGECLALIAHTRAFVGMRLHSTILATVTETPAQVFYYVDKGRIYFEQLGLSGFSAPIESLLERQQHPKHLAAFQQLMEQGDSVCHQSQQVLTQMRQQLTSILAEHLPDSPTTEQHR